MSKLSEYSKFDHLIDDDDDDDTSNDVPSSTTRSVATSTLPPSDVNEIRHVRKHPIASAAVPNQSTYLRFMAQYNGHTVYEWEQSLNEVIIYIVSPIQNRNQGSDDANAKIICHISATHLQVGIQKNHSNPLSDNINYYIVEDIYHPIETKESTWCIEQEDLDADTNSSKQQQDVITIYLQKVAKGMVWEAPLRGHSKTAGTAGDGKNANNSNILDPFSLQDVQKSLLLERWQEENPGMDFRDATFNGGSIPDPRTYMGGIGYQ
jgi:CS domain